MNSSMYIAVFFYLAIVSGQQTKTLKVSDEITPVEIPKEDSTSHRRVKRRHDPASSVSQNECNPAVLACCSDKIKTRQCFRSFDCELFYERGESCSIEIIQSALEQFKEAFSTNDSSNTQNRDRRWHYAYDQQQTTQTTPQPGTQISLQSLSQTSPQPQYQKTEDYNANQQEYLPRIFSLLEEITTYVKKPQQQPVVPHTIYVPYPVPYPVPQTNSKGDTVNVPDILSRGPPIEDVSERGSVDLKSNDGKDGARPISFVPIKPDRALKRLTPKVEHGSIQDVQSSSQEFLSVSTTVAENKCTAAIVTCCADNKNEQKGCFYTLGCGTQYDNGNVCNSDSIKDAIESYKITFLQ